jgi:hypothetical protein
MARARRTYILDDLPTDEDALDFTPYVKTLANVCKTTSAPCKRDVLYNLF